VDAAADWQDNTPMERFVHGTTRSADEVKCFELANPN